MNGGEKTHFLIEKLKFSIFILNLIETVDLCVKWLFCNLRGAGSPQQTSTLPPAEK